MRRIGFVALLAFVVGLVSQASPRAAWLDLADGQYEVTLECAFSSVIACPTDIIGSLTIAGSGATAMEFTINGELFGGDPLDGDTADFQFSQLSHTPFSFLSIRDDFVPPSPANLGEHYWVYCHTNPDPQNPNTCLPQTGGDWSAARIAQVPEPMSLLLFAVGLVGFGLCRRRSRAGRLSGSLMRAYAG